MKADAEPMPLLEVRDLSVDLYGRRILEKVNLQLFPGTLHAIIGPNGGGKSTLIRALLGELAHQGGIRYRFRGGAVIGLLPQFVEFDRKSPMTALDFLHLASSRIPIFLAARAKTRERIAELAAACDCWHLLDRRMGRLSGGEMRRVLLCQALVNEPELLILDEAESHVDQAGNRAITALLCELKRRRGLSILLVGHDLASIARIADRVSAINRQVLFSGPGALLEFGLAQARERACDPFELAELEKHYARWLAGKDSPAEPQGLRIQTLEH